MTYNVLMGSLNPTHSLTVLTLRFCCLGDRKGIGHFAPASSKCSFCRTWLNV